jgi:hypothetical protein
MKQNAILIGSGLMLGMGVGFFFLRSNPLAFVGCLFLGLGLDTLLNLFSSSENSTASSSLQKSIGNDLVKSLISKGLGKGKSSSIVQLILPILISKISGLIGGDKNNLTQLLGSSGNSKLGSIGGSLLKKLFN